MLKRDRFKHRHRCWVASGQGKGQENNMQAYLRWNRRQRILCEEDLGFRVDEATFSNWLMKRYLLETVS
jgi:hypothetical protein